MLPSSQYYKEGIQYTVCVLEKGSCVKLFLKEKELSELNGHTFMLSCEFVFKNKSWLYFPGMIYICPYLIPSDVCL